MMENLGLGATLDFTEGPALAGMQRAGAGLTRLEGSFNTFRDNIRKVGESLDHLNVAAMGMGALGMAGIGEAFHKSWEARGEIEDMQIVLASTLQMTNKNIKEMGDFSNQAGTAMGIAADQMEMIEINAAAAPGEARDLLGIYKQILGPMTAAGQSLEQVQSVTKGAAIAAQALGIPFQDMAFSMDRLISGSVREQDTLFRSLKSQNLITESAGEWAALSKADRLKKINDLMERYGKNADLIGSTWSAMSGTIQSIVKMLGSSFVTPLFDAVKQALKPVTEVFIGAENVSDEARLAIVKHWKEVAKQAGEKLVPVFRFFVEVIKQVWSNMQRAYEWGTALAARIADILPAGDGFHQIAVHAGAIAVALAGILPMLSLLRVVIGPVMAIVNLLLSGIGMIGTAFTSVGSIMGGVLAFVFSGPGMIMLALVGALVGAMSTLRHENESWGEAAARIWEDDILPGWESMKAWISDVWSNYLSPFITGFQRGFGVFIPEIISNLQDAWFNLKQAISLLFDAISDNINNNKGDMKDYGNDVGAIIGGITAFVSRLITTITGLIGTIVYVFANVKYIFESISTAIATFFFNATLGVINIVKGLYNAVITPIQMILNFIASTLETLNRSDMVRKAMGKLGIDLSAEATSFRKMTSGSGWASDSAYMDAGKYEFGESPEEAYFRKRREGEPLKKAAAENKPMSFEAEIIDRSHRCVDANLKVNMDGSAISAAVARQQIELNERAGAQDTPYQRRAVVMRSDLGVGRR